MPLEGNLVVILSRKYLVTAATSIALAATFTIAPTAIQIASFDDAAYAKNGGGGNGGGGKGKSAGNSKQKKKPTAKGGGKARSGNTVRTTKKQAAPQETLSSEAEIEAMEDNGELVALTPDQKGRWNAIKANQRDVHIRNQKFNGTVGMLSYYQLAGKAASGAELNDYEQAALDNLIGDTTPVFTDGELEDVLNNPGVSSAPVYKVTDGVASCIDYCDGAPDGSDAIADYTEEREREAEETAVQDLFADAEKTIIGNSNKSTDGIENQLLDELALDLGFSREDTGVDP